MKNSSPAKAKPAKIDTKKAQNIIFQPNPGPQTDFLAAPEQEALFGGSAGGGKSFAMVADPMRYVNNPRANMLLVRRSTEELRELISVSKQLYPQAIPEAKFLERDKTWVFPSGATLWMSYLDRDDDVSRYQGQAFCVAEGTKVLTSPNESVPVETLKVGDPVFSLSGTKKITWVSGRQTKKCVKVSFYSSEGHLLGQQLQPDTHPIALLSSKPYLQLSDLSRNIEKFQLSPLQWLSYKHLQSVCQENPETYVSQEGDQNCCKEFEHDSQESPQPLGLFYPAVRYVPSLQLDQDHTATQCCSLCKSLPQSSDSDKGSLKNDEGQPQPYGPSQLYKGCSRGQELPCDDVSCVQLEKQTVLNSLGSCFSYCDLCGALLPLGQAAFEVDAQLLGDVELQDLGNLHYDEMGCTPSHNRYLCKQYTHPYTQEPQHLEVPLELCIVRVEPLENPFLNVFDISVEAVNNYITEGGLVNKNCWIGFDELTQWQTPYAWNYMRSRLRVTKDSGLNLYQRATTNPGGAGHRWVKKMFIDPAPYNNPFWATDIESGEIIKFPKGHIREDEPLFKRRFIPATLKDNPYLDEDGMYEANLLSLPEHQRRQLLEGDWSINEGAAFPEFNPKIHVIEPFDIPNSWMRFRAADYGYGSYTGVLWFAVAPSDQLIVYRELYVSKVTAADLAGMILEAEAGEKMRYGVLDSSLWHNRGDTGPSLAEQMIIRGCRWRPADRSRGSRVSGKNEVHRRLQIDEFTGESRLVVFNNCRNLIAQLPSIPLDKNNPEDVDTNAEDHLYDALRYGIMTRPKNSLFDFDSPNQNKGFQAADPVMGY
jgi:hypothetical protein